MILVVDNYDSFTYNLVHYLAELGAPTHVVRNDDLTTDQAWALNPAAVLLSLDKLYQDFPERAQGYLERFRRDCLTLCRPVRVLYPGGTREGTAVDITEDFGLTVRWPDGTVEAVDGQTICIKR